MWQKLKDWARLLRRDALALWLAARHAGTPLHAKVFLFFVVAYALSPIDLIPDFIPVLGMLDEVLLLPVAIWIAQRLVPAPVMAECREQATRLAERPRSLLGAALMIFIWLVVIALLARYFTRA